jgi:ABC-type multidrug transport system fused ATPase/permease subunit
MGPASGYRFGMHTSRKLLGQVRRALVAAFVLGCLAMPLQLALPLYALHLFEGAARPISLETLALLTSIAAGGALALVCLAAARDRILLRAGLWLDHTLGRHMLENGARLGTPPAEMEKAAGALARLTGALGERSIAALFDAPWVPLLLVALVLLHPMLGAVAAASAVLLVMAMLLQGRRVRALGQQQAEAKARIAAWWSASLPRSADHQRLNPGAPDQWERLNRAHIAAAYALGRRGVLLQDLARAASIGSLIATMAAGAWLTMAHELTAAAMFASVLITAALLAPLERLAAALPAVHSALAAYRQLRALPADAPEDEADAICSSPPPRAMHATARPLNVRGPVALGLAVVLLMVAVGVAATYARLGDLAGLAGGTIFETRLTPLRYPRLGANARVHVAEGAIVKAGDLIVTRDTADLDRQIVMLKALAETAKAQSTLLGEEAKTLSAPAERVEADRPKLASLEQRIAELEQESQELLSRIARAEQELAKSAIRAPVSGRVVALSLGRPGTPDAEAVELEIATADRPLLERLLAPIRRGRE